MNEVFELQAATPLSQRLEKRLSRRQMLQLLGKGALTVSVLTVVTACSAAGNDRYVISMLMQNQLQPASLTIPQGTTVLWHNYGALVQSATCDPAKATDPDYVHLPANAQPWDSGEIDPGQTWAYTFTTPGSYVYFSRFQVTPSMLGTITVTG